MAFTAQGHLWIEMADVYTWLEQQGVDTEGCKAPWFSRQDPRLVIEYHDGRATREIDGAEFWRWILEEHFPEGMAHAETVFGVPKVEDTDLVIDYACSTECSPTQWSTPPAFLQEWKQPDPA